MIECHGSGDPDESRLGWQGDGIDVEIAAVTWKRSVRYCWSLYHHARLVKTGIRRTHRGAELAGSWAAWWYRRTTRYHGL